MQKHLSAHKNKEPLNGVTWMGNTMEEAGIEEISAELYSDETEV